MSYKLIHFVPFDIGLSFLDNKIKTNYIKNTFKKFLYDVCLSKKYSIDEGKNDDSFFNLTINEYLSCFFMNCGVGVFVIKENPIINKELNKKIGNHIEAQIYYQRKNTHKEILEWKHKYSDIINDLINTV
ncbi:hypothetical protein [Mycoplasma elephantis]|uniref:hypothetical protein n=1 Tax=Mycoplasma elephantis TaxID=114882 RepID=UPI0004851BD9|nr:hypothetical protein [Mycoplasma elephantis]